MNRNQCVNIGHSSRLSYDDCAYDDKLNESTGPLKYRMDTSRIHNCDACFAPFGPRSRYGVSMPNQNQPAVSQSEELVNLESILTNRNLSKSRCKRNQSNPVDITQYKLKNPRICDQSISPLSTRLSDPAANYRDLSINRFYNLNKNPQANIFWNFATNTSLEAKDNYIPDIPEPWSNMDSLPKPIRGCPKDTILKIRPPC